MDKQQTKGAVKKKRRSSEKSIKFRCDYSSTPLKVLESRGWTRIYDPKDRHWDLWWCDSGEIKLALDNLQRLRSHQRVAHFLGHSELTRKNLLYRNLRRYKRLLLKAGKCREAALCDVMPVSFELPSEYRMLVEEYRRSQGGTWIVKPAAGSQGRGIFLFQRLKDLAEWRSKEYPPPSADPMCEAELPAPPDIYIVQKYIDDPYLLGGCKFDIRIFVLVTSFQPLKVWLAREGFARLSGEQFSLERIDDSRVHLTNMSIQLKTAQQRDYERTSPPVKLGSKWPLSCLRQYLTERHGHDVVDELLHNVAEMAKIAVWHNGKKVHISKNDNGNLLLSSLREHFPSADGLTYEDKEGKMQCLAVESEQVILNPKVKKYLIHRSSKASHTDKASAAESIEKSVNTENGTDGKCTQENKSNERQADPEKPAQENNFKKTLRIGWLNKPHGKTKYRKVAKPLGGVKKLKLDASVSYLAYQIRRLAIEAFEAQTNRPIEDEYLVNLGNFGGQAITDFRLQDGRVCDIWEYCKDRGKTLYQLNLFVLTSSLDEDDDDEEVGDHRTISTRRVKARRRVVSDVRVLYLYVRRSCYTDELSYVDCERSVLYGRVFEDEHGACPAIEHFEPAAYGYAISRIEKAGRVLMQVTVDDGSGVKSTEFPATMGSEEHVVLHDVDELQGYCESKFGVGFVPSCGHKCRPVFSWYRDGELFKEREFLYWLDDVADEREHTWSCSVACASTGRCIRSKEVRVDGK